MLRESVLAVSVKTLFNKLTYFDFRAVVRLKLDVGFPYLDSNLRYVGV